MGYWMVDCQEEACVAPHSSHIQNALIYEAVSVKTAHSISLEK